MFVADNTDLDSVSMTQMAVKATTVGELTQNNDHYTIPGQQVWHQSTARMQFGISE